MNTLESPDATGKTAGNNRIKGCFGILVILLSMFLVLNLLAGSVCRACWQRPSSGEGSRFPDICCRPSSETQSPDPLFWESPPVPNSLWRL